MTTTADRPPVADILKGVDLVKLAEGDGLTLRGMGEKHGPCPKCKGRDRFYIRHYNDKDYFRCRQCHTKSGDALEYLKWMRGLSFIDALQFLGEKRGQYTTTTQRAANVQTPGSAPVQTWQNFARVFVEACERKLWTSAGAPALAYLRARGLTDDTIRRFHLGYNWRDWLGMDAREWGIGRPVYIWRGITIPRDAVGELWAVNVRRMNADGTPHKGDGKYKAVTGSKSGALWGADALKDARAALVLGGEFDAMLAAQHVPNGVAVVTFGGEGVNVRDYWRAMLANVADIFLCLDNDNAGDGYVAKWLDVPHVRRVRVPVGYKDLTEFAQSGGDVLDWIRDVINMPLIDALVRWGELKGYAPEVEGSRVIMRQGAM